MQWKNYMQGTMHECPYEIGPLRIYNYTDTYHQQMDALASKQSRKQKAQQKRFKGDIRIQIKFSTEEDPNVLDFALDATVNQRH